MKVRAPDGKEYSLKLSGREVDPNRTCSQGHAAARDLLLAAFPYEKIFEEVFIPGCGTPLFADLLIPSRRLMVEVQGAQHRQYCAFFHGSKQKFLQQRRRDGVKKEWAVQNRILPLELHDDRIAEWAAQLAAAMGLHSPTGGAEAGPARVPEDEQGRQERPH